MRTPLIAAGAAAVLTLGTVAAAAAAQLGSEPDDIDGASFVAELGENTVDGSVGPVDSDASDAFSVDVPEGLGVASVSFSGSVGAVSASGCGASAADEVLDPPAAGPCTLGWVIDADAVAVEPAAWTVTVMVVDVAAPVLTVPADIEVSTDAGEPTAVVEFEATATDNIDGDVAVTCDPASGSAFAVGTTTVQCSATDAAGNEGTASFDVTVADTEPPVITTGGDVQAWADSLYGANVEYEADATDNVGVTEFGCDPGSGTVFGLGQTTVECDAADAAGNTASDSFDVTVSVAPNGSSINIIQDDIASQGLDNGTGTSLGAPLSSADKLLDDDNANNDKAVCNKTEAFLKHVDKKQQQGKISDEYADALNEFTDGEYGLRQAIGC